jgi:hypothetical protein
VIAKQSDQQKAETSLFLGTPEVRALALRNLGLAPGMGSARSDDRTYADVSSLTFRAECIRATLWAATNAGDIPVYVTRLLGSVEPLLKPDPNYRLAKLRADKSAPEPREMIRAALEEMELVGDVARLPHGYWLPAPLRVVPLPAMKRWLMLGGTPNAMLPEDLVPTLEHSGVARFATAEPAGLPQEKEETWCRIPSEPLAAWTAQVINNTELRELDDPDLELEFYAPAQGATRGKAPFQTQRWTAVTKSLLDGLYLCRQRLFRAMVHYAVAKVQNRRTVATGPLDRNEVSVRRLMYGMDDRCGCPVGVKRLRQGHSTTFILGNEVPRPEHRLLTALAELRLPQDGKYYPRLWTCDSRYEAQIDKCLERLGVRLEDTTNSKSW